MPLIVNRIGVPGWLEPGFKPATTGLEAGSDYGGPRMRRTDRVHTDLNPASSRLEAIAGLKRSRVFAVNRIIHQPAWFAARQRQYGQAIVAKSMLHRTRNAERARTAPAAQRNGIVPARREHFVIAPPRKADVNRLPGIPEEHANDDRQGRRCRPVQHQIHERDERPGRGQVRAVSIRNPARRNAARRAIGSGFDGSVTKK